MGRLSRGEKISAGSAVLLLIFMPLGWFGTKNSGELQLLSVGRNAWEALDYIWIVLVSAIAAALGVAALRFTNAVRLPSRAHGLVATLGTVSALLILFRILDPPNFGYLQELWGTFPIEGTVQLPCFLGLLAALGIAFGGYRAAREEGREKCMPEEGLEPPTRGL